MSEFFKIAQRRVGEIVQAQLSAERERRRRGWPDYTQFQWATDEGWATFLRCSSGVELKAKLEAAAWQLLFCEAFAAVGERLEGIEATLNGRASGR